MNADMLDYSQFPQLDTLTQDIFSLEYELHVLPRACSAIQKVSFMDNSLKKVIDQRRMFEICFDYFTKPCVRLFPHILISAK